MDPVGAVLISLVIISRWVDVMKEQIRKIVGHTAPPEFVQLVNTMAIEHDVRLVVDVIRAYHFGARYNVEMEIVLPGKFHLYICSDVIMCGTVLLFAAISYCGNSMIGLCCSTNCIVIVC